MAFFDFLKRKKEAAPDAVSAAINNTSLPESNDTAASTPSIKGIESIYLFLQADYETRGYNDAFVSPDESYKNDNIKLLIQDYEILLQQVTTYYEDMQQDLDFHIITRSRAGLVDLIEELKTKKGKVAEHIEKVSLMKQDIKNNTGMSQRIVLSYGRGFLRGLSALTKSNILNKDL